MVDSMLAEEELTEVNSAAGGGDAQRRFSDGQSSGSFPGSPWRRRSGRKGVS